MFYPWNWMGQDKFDPENPPKNFKPKWRANYNIPEAHCTRNSEVDCNPKLYKGGIFDFFTNDTWLSKDLTQRRRKRTPANRPGKAAIFGEGCGVNGGK